MQPTLTYTNAQGESITFGPLMPYHVDLSAVTGLSDIENEIYTISSMGQDGDTYVDSRLTAREIQIPGSATGDPAALPAMRRRLMRVLSPKLEGTLIYTGDVVRAISVRVRTAPTWQEGNGLYPAFTLQLAALDPYWRDAGDTVTHIALWLGMFEFPLPDGLEIIDGQWQVGQRSPSLIINLINQGDVSAGLEITFRALGALSTPALVDVNTQEYIRFDLTMAAGDVLTVSTGYGRKRATLTCGGITTDAFGYMEQGSTFLQAQPGDNLYRYMATSGQDNLEVAIRHNNRYLTV